MTGFREGLEKAYETERLAVVSYMKALQELCMAGLANPLVKQVFLKIVLDSVVHKNLVKALIESLEEIRLIEREAEQYASSASSSRITREHVEFLEKVIESHDRLEEGIERLYEELAGKAPTQLMARVLRAIAEDEKRHEEYLEEVRKLVERQHG